MHVPVERGLGGAVAELRNFAGNRAGGRGEQNRTAALGEHVRQGVFARQHAAQHVDPHAVVEQLGVEVDEVDIAGCGRVSVHGVIEQYVDTTEGLDGLLDHLPQGVFLTNIHLHGHCLGTYFSCHGLRRFGEKVGDHYRGALPGKTQCRGAADATAGAGDHADLAV